MLVSAAQLSKSLPSLLVNILEDKVDREYLKDMSRALSDVFTDDRHGQDDDGLVDLPKNWEPMKLNEVNNSSCADCCSTLACIVCCMLYLCKENITLFSN